MLIPVAWRRKASSLPGAIHSVSADLLSGSSRRLPGELSVTATAVAWIPSNYSRRHGQEEVMIAAGDIAAITISRGPALLDLIVSVRGPDGYEWRFGTHSSRKLRDALEGLRGAAAGLQ